MPVGLFLADCFSLTMKDSLLIGSLEVVNHKMMIVNIWVVNCVNRHIILVISFFLGVSRANWFSPKFTLFCHIVSSCTIFHSLSSTQFQFFTCLQCYFWFCIILKLALWFCRFLCLVGLEKMGERDWLDGSSRNQLAFSFYWARSHLAESLCGKYLHNSPSVSDCIFPRHDEYIVVHMVDTCTIKSTLRGS